MYNQSNRHPARQAGIVSIMLTLVMMLVISLIVLGFAQISRRNQRQSLDRQLSTQAFYAAETGVNDARELIVNAIAAAQAVPPKPDCTPGAGATATFYNTLTTGATLDAANSVKYTCVIVDPTPTTLSYAVGLTSTIIPVISTTANITNIRLEFKSTDATATPTVGCPITASGVFSSTTSWACGYGVLRLDIVPTAGSALTMAGLQSTTKTTFLVPFSSGGATTLDNASWNNRLGTQCTNTSCILTITGLNSSQYHMRISAVYKGMSLLVSATDSTGASLSLSGAQAIIDATGKAQDVLRRIQVHVPLTASSQNLLSDYALQSNDSFCKRFSVMTGYYNSSVPGGSPTGQILCRP